MEMGKKGDQGGGQDDLIAVVCQSLTFLVLAPLLSLAPMVTLEAQVVPRARYGFIFST